MFLIISPKLLTENLFETSVIKISGYERVWACSGASRHLRHFPVSWLPLRHVLNLIKCSDKCVKRLQKGDRCTRCRRSHGTPVWSPLQATSVHVAMRPRRKTCSCNLSKVSKQSFSQCFVVSNSISNSLATFKKRLWASQLDAETLCGNKWPTVQE